MNATTIAWTRNSRPSHMCYHAEFGRSALKGVGINTGEPPNRGALKLCCLNGMGGVVVPRYTPLHHVLPCQIWSYRAEFGCSRLNGTSVIDWEAVLHRQLGIHIRKKTQWKKRLERRKHCALAVVRRSQKFGGAGQPKFNHLEMVTTFTYRPSLVTIDARNFELLC